MGRSGAVYFFRMMWGEVFFSDRIPATVLTLCAAVLFLPDASPRLHSQTNLMLRGWYEANLESQCQGLESFPSPLSLSSGGALGRSSWLFFRLRGGVSPCELEGIGDGTESHGLRLSSYKTGATLNNPGSPWSDELQDIRRDAECGCLRLFGGYKSGSNLPIRESPEELEEIRKGLDSIHSSECNKEWEFYSDSKEYVSQPGSNDVNRPCHSTIPSHTWTLDKSCYSVTAEIRMEYFCYGKEIFEPIDECLELFLRPSWPLRKKCSATGSADMRQASKALHIRDESVGCSFGLHIIFRFRFDNRVCKIPGVQDIDVIACVVSVLSPRRTACIPQNVVTADGMCFCPALALDRNVF